MMLADKNKPWAGAYLEWGCLLLAILYFGRILFIPLSYGFFIAIVLWPACKWLERKHWPRTLAITACLSVLIIAFILLCLLLLAELGSLRKEWPAIVQKLTPVMQHLQQQLFPGEPTTNNNWWSTFGNKIAVSLGALLPGTFRATGNMLFILLMAPVFGVLFLYNRATFIRSLEKLAGQYNQSLHQILQQTADTYFKFIKGMAIVYLLVGLLNSLGLMALGIPHAFLFGMLTAIMTIIPYAGIVISALLPITVAWITKDSLWYPAGVIMIFTVVQYLEANIIFPRVVAAQIKVSTWATLVAIILGGLLWGASGMILFVPFTGILKIIAGHLAPDSALNILLSR